jgi:nitroreductase
MSAKFSKENISKLDKDVLRTVIRERAHHTLEAPLYEILRGKRKITHDFAHVVKDLFSIWESYGVADKCPDMDYVRKLLGIAEQVKHGEKANLETEPIAPFSDSEIEAVERLFVERRSIRFWTDQEVPQWLLKKIMEAGRWAPHACNVQSIRFLPITDNRGMEVFAKSETRGGTAKLVACQDMRGYEFYSGPNEIPDYNSYLDCGAAMQNMLLMAHALGLGAVWLTFRPSEVQALRKLYNLPSYIRLTTYMALGWPAETPIPPGRMTIEDMTLPTRRRQT